jgi:2',3'-cyclic-nucleotide 2'-phosphodiesterase / 3'-nucleotidase / 5'-nucleotidase
MKKICVAAVATVTCALAAMPAGASNVKELELSFVGRTAPAGETGAEIAAFDPDTERAFVTNALANSLDVFDLSDPSAPVPVGTIPLGQFGGVPNSVDTTDEHGGLVAVAMEAPVKTDPGTVELFDADGRHLDSIGAGAQPDMLTFADHGDRLLIANEGEPATDGSVDPEGSVTVIDLDDGLDDIRRRTARFRGVRLRGPVRIFGPGATPAQDLEPEYIAAFGDRAWVTLQENNAIGLLDLDRARFDLVRSLGFKDHGLVRNAFDPSDEDGIEIEPWDNVFGMYQPDAIAAYRTDASRRSHRKRGGRGGARVRLVTANEGDARDWDFFAEEERVGDLPLDPNAFAPDASEDENLGRLTVTTTLGDPDGDGDFDELYPLGGRSMSVLDDDGRIEFDTGSLLEEFTAGLGLDFFNLDNAEGSEPDNRSDNKGPEPEGIAVGEVRNRKYAFLGLERQGGILAFDLEARRGEARIAGYINTRDDDLGPEGIEFVPAEESPTDEALLLVTYEISGTLAVYSLSALR